MIDTARNRAAAAALKVLSHDDFSDVEIAAIIRGEKGLTHRRDAFALVDAVLDAIREPDQAMVRAAYEAESDPDHYALDPDDSDFRPAFTAAIDAAREQPHGD